MNRRCEHVEEHADFSGPDGLGGGYVIMKCTARAKWVVVLKGLDVRIGSRYSFARRYCTEHATFTVNAERDEVASGWIMNSAIKVICLPSGMAVTVYTDRPEMGVRIVRGSK